MWFDADELQAGAPEIDPSLQQQVCLTFFIGIASASKAEALQKAAAHKGWSSTVHVDKFGWVVRLVHNGDASGPSLERHLADAQRLAAGSAGELRGLTIEDVGDHDAWDDLAEDVFSSALAERQAAAVPSQAAPDEDVPSAESAPRGA